MLDHVHPTIERLGCLAIGSIEPILANAMMRHRRGREGLRSDKLDRSVYAP